jgi:hypothetical protein
MGDRVRDGMKMSPRPPVHPCADELAEFLRNAFAEEAKAVLADLKMANGVPGLMRFLEAYGYVWEPTDHADQALMQRREGMRRVALMVAAANDINPNDLETETDDGKQRRSSDALRPAEYDDRAGLARLRAEF